MSKQPTVRAYLVLWLDMRGKLPVVVDAGVYAESRPTTLDFAGRYPLPHLSSQGSTYANAVENLRQYVRGMPHMKWALAYFPGG